VSQAAPTWRCHEQRFTERNDSEEGHHARYACHGGVQHHRDYGARESGSCQHRQAGLRSVGTGSGQCHYTYTSPDSGLGGNDWANDTINRQLEIWEVDGGYCASVKDQGSFVTVAGASPGNTDTVSAGITSKLKGGYTTTLLTLTGTFNPNNMPTRGNLGTYDHTNRPSFMSYGLSGALADWGWVYETANNGSWVNASIPRQQRRHHRLRRNDQTAREGRREPPLSCAALAAKWSERSRRSNIS
jgi:hypothetical protein